MAQQDSKRALLFTRYSSQLHRLAGLGYIPNDIELKYNPTYICPICKNPFSESDLDESSTNRLTLEDAPPDSLGGRKIALTCKVCNNTCGYRIDSHLSLGMNELDNRSFLPGSEIQMSFKKDGKIVNGQLTVEENGIATARHLIKQNNPVVLNQYLSELNAGESLQVNFKKSKLDNRKLILALLKTGYIMTFAKFGYAFLLDKFYNPIREQLLNPEKNIYPLNFWTSKPFEAHHEGVHLVNNAGAQGFLSIFPLSTKLETRWYAVFIPATGTCLETAISNLNKTNGLALSLDSALGDFISDMEMVKDLERWRVDHLMSKMGFQ
jgi:hypothetical protein